MNTNQVTKKAAQGVGSWAYSTIQHVAKVFGAWGVIIATLTAFFAFVNDGAIQPIIRVMELPDKVNHEFTEIKQTTDREFENINQRLTDIELALNELRVAPDVAEYDLRFSQIVGAICNTGSNCDYRFRLRRTEEGDSCGLPELHPKVRNGRGDIYFVSLVNTEAERVSDNWTILTGTFEVPATIPVGDDAAFFMDLLYPSCSWLNENQKQPERTPELEFVIVDGTTN